MVICVFQRIKEKKTYTDVDIDDDEIEGKRNYSIEEKLKSHRYNKRYVRHLKGEGKYTAFKIHYMFTVRITISVTMNYDLFP